jgi:hypothetical protein
LSCLESGCFSRRGDMPAYDARSLSLKLSYHGSIVLPMPRGNPSPKLAITVDPDVHERVIAMAIREGVSVSAWMTAAARQALIVRDGLDAVAEWEKINGPFTDEELRAARRRVAKEIGPRRKRSA